LIRLICVTDVVMQVTVIIIVIMITIITTNLRNEVNEKSAVLCKSLPHFVCIKLSFKVTNIIYAKPIRLHVKLYNFSLRHSSAISSHCDVQIAKCALGKRNVSGLIQVVST